MEESGSYTEGTREVTPATWVSLCQKRERVLSCTPMWAFCPEATKCLFKSPRSSEASVAAAKSHQNLSEALEVGLPRSALWTRNQGADQFSLLLEPNRGCPEV